MKILYLKIYTRINNKIHLIRANKTEQNGQAQMHEKNFEYKYTKNSTLIPIRIIYNYFFSASTNCKLQLISYIFYGSKRNIDKLQNVNTEKW